MWKFADPNYVGTSYANGKRHLRFLWKEKKQKENVETIPVEYALGPLEEVFCEESSAVVGKKGKN
jgi:hypothetical protein